MIFVDYRAGSKELIVPLEAEGLEVEETTLDKGDVMFVGRGIGDADVDVGIEFKKLAEMCQSIRDGRFAADQLPGMTQQYGDRWLLVEGYWRAGNDGLMTTYLGKRGWQTMRGKMPASEFEKHLLTYQLCGGIKVRFTNTRRDTVRFLADLYRWWTDQALDEHSSHIAVHRPAALMPLSDFRKAVSQWPGIGIKTSKAVEQAFNGSIIDAATAPTKVWAMLRIGGKAFGWSKAERLVAFLRGEKP